MNPKPPLIIYHGNCYDGLTAAWVAKQANELENVFADFHPAKHGDPPPDVEGREVDILDFAYPRAVLLEMSKRALAIHLLDHHKTAAEDLRGMEEHLTLLKFDMDRSGAGLAWQHYIGGEAPQTLLWIEDRDLWRFKYGDDTKHAHAYVASLPMTFEAWDELMALDPAEVVRRGRSIRGYLDRYCEKAAEETRIVEWPEGLVALVNVPYQNASEMAGVLLDRYPQVLFSAGWFQRADGQIQFSLRSRGDYDVSEVARHRDGGGHAGAAGFSLPFDEALGLIRGIVKEGS